MPERIAFHAIALDMDDVKQGLLDEMEISNQIWYSLASEVADQTGHLDFLDKIRYPFSSPPPGGDVLIFPSGMAVIRVPCLGDRCLVCNLFQALRKALPSPENVKAGYYELHGFPG
ncbi:MAG: hypothetical protein QW734_02295 [Candidatus Bathyarchaeia archaeon]